MINKSAEQQWIDLCNERMVDDKTQVIWLETLVREHGLFGELVESTHEALLDFSNKP